MNDDDGSIFDHLDDGDEPDLQPLEEFNLPGQAGGGFRFDVRDPDALGKIQRDMAEHLAKAREQLERRLAAERELMVRATQPGFFEFCLSHQRDEMNAFVRAEFLAQAALERRIAAIEDLIATKLMALDVEVRGG